MNWTNNKSDYNIVSWEVTEDECYDIYDTAINILVKCTLDTGQIIDFWESYSFDDLYDQSIMQRLETFMNDYVKKGYHDELFAEQIEAEEEFA